MSRSDAFAYGRAGDTWRDTPPEGCECGKGSIQVLDINGAVIGQFIRLRDSYYGGSTHDTDRNLFLGPHVWLDLGAMLDLVARLADQEQPYPYELHRYGGSSGYENVQLTRHMNARQLARALGCTEQQVRDHYGLVVKLA